jgi:DNA (cytosine-5)-methyltransferase 1
MRHASLFSGIGGPEVAAAMLGWENVFHCEINEFGRKVLEYWFPNSDSYEDITKTDFRKFRGTIDVLTGGFPCQPFSYAGKRGGQQDQRYLWPEMLRVINEVRPTWVIGENVAGIGTMVEQCRITDMGSEATLFEEGGGLHRYTAEYTFTIERICSDPESKGYSVQPMLIPACAVGAPHRRDRIFFIAYNVADSNSCDDLRKSGKDDSEGREKWLQKRNKIRIAGESASIRPSIQSFTSEGLEPENKWKGLFIDFSFKNRNFRWQLNNQIESYDDKWNNLIDKGFHFDGNDSNSLIQGLESFCSESI